MATFKKMNQRVEHKLKGDRLDSMATLNAQLLTQISANHDKGSPQNTHYSGYFNVIRNALDSQINQMSKASQNQTLRSTGSSVTSEAINRINMALMSANQHDRRKVPRYCMSLACKLMWENTIYPLHSTDISSQGIRLFGAIPADISIGATVALQIQNLGALNCHVKNNGRHGLNLAFCQPFSSSEKAMIAGLLLALSGENDMLVSRAKDMALAIQHVFEKAVADNLIAETVLFKNSYQPVPETEPQQYITSATEFYEMALTPLVEHYFKSYRNVIYAVATDRNGYVPVHNTPFSFAQKAGDAEFNLACARNKRIYRDPTTLLASRFSKGAIIQSYPRDTDCVSSAPALEASAPIMIRGRRWGCAQIAFSASAFAR